MNTSATTKKNAEVALVIAKLHMQCPVWHLWLTGEWSLKGNSAIKKNGIDPHSTIIP